MLSKTPTTKTSTIKKGYLPNFPITASSEDLTSVLESGILYERVSARTYKDTGIKLGGWTAHAHMDSVTPESVVFDDKVYAILWKERSKKPTAKPDETTEPAKPNETTEPAKLNNQRNLTKLHNQRNLTKLHNQRNLTKLRHDPKRTTSKCNLSFRKIKGRNWKKKTASSNNHGNRIDKKTKI